MLHFDQLQTPVWIYDTVNFRIHWANSSALDLWQADSLPELTSRDFRTDASDAVYQTLLTYLDEFEKGHSICRWWRLSPQGQVKDVYCQFSGIRLDDGHMAMLVEGLETDKDQLNPLFSGAAVVSLLDAKGDLISASPSLQEQFGGQIHQLANLLQYPEQVPVLLKIVSEQSFHQEDIRVKTLRGCRWYSIELRRARSAAEGQFTVTLQDIHDRKSRELQFQQMALLDPLTGILNRTGMMQKLSLLVERDISFSLFYLDLDGFKPINDSFGHGAGDELLLEVANRLRQLAGEGTMIARIGGDEFIVAVENAASEEQRRDFASSIVATVSGQYRVVKESMEISLSVSVGIACFPEHEQDLNLLLADADTAMYMAKNSGRRCWLEYRQGMREQFHRRTHISQKLSVALSDNEFSLVYQPIINVTTGSVIVVETLVRWNSPELGVVSAEELIDAAEHCGMIREISSWIYKQACQDFIAIRNRFGEQVLLSVNISGLQILQGSVVESLVDALADTGLKPDDLVLELTENVMLPDSTEYAGTINQLVAMGFGIAIDDFGSGFSCLAYLNSIPADWVKLDREFVRQLNKGTETIRCINQLINALGMQVIVEGIENQTQSHQLQACGVLNQQGFWHSKPIGLQGLLKGSGELRKINDM